MVKGGFLIVIARMKCKVVALPQGLSFKQPAKYTATELLQIQNNKENVQFIQADTRS